MGDTGSHSAATDAGMPRSLSGGRGMEKTGDKMTIEKSAQKMAAEIDFQLDCIGIFILFKRVLGMS
ncbi:MAG: hypothetical protein B6D35_02180 [Candidatus Brocadia sp. UTAMX2]|jgi:hypothetical protein|nr:MAG: hypothetical protein B6D35_02180 [Candidatus Brocadia sp. UTAMX2]